MAAANPEEEEREALLRRVIELLPHMVFAKDGGLETRDDYDKGFRCVWFGVCTLAGLMDGITRPLAVDRSICG
jgi:hypothetical protein